MPKQQSEWMIEQAIPEDAHALAYMHAESFKAAYLRDDERDVKVLAEAAAFVTPERIEARIELILRSFKSPDEFYYVATDEDAHPIGLVYGYKTESIQELSALYVDVSYFGRGVGKELAQAFIDWCDPERPIELGVVEDNERAKRFYRKMGFVAVGDVRESFYDFLRETTMTLSPRKGESV